MNSTAAKGIPAVTVVSNKKRALTLKTAWITKKQHISLPSDVQAPNPTPKAMQSMNAVSNNSIPQNSDLSTPKVKKSSDVKFSKSAQTETDKRYLAASKEETKKAAEAENEKNDVRTSKITKEDVSALRSIGRKSINDFTSEDIQKSEAWARKFYQELGTKSPFFRAWFGDWRAYDTSKTNIVPVETIDLADVVMQAGDYDIADTGWTVHAGRILQKETEHYARGAKVSVKALNSIQKF